MTGEGGLVEVQATAERTPLSRTHLDELLALAQTGIEGLRDGAGSRAAMRGPVRLLLATGNDHKLREFARLLPGVTLDPLPKEHPSPEETGDTYAENALIKARGGGAGDRARGVRRRQRDRGRGAGLGARGPDGPLRRRARHRPARTSTSCTARRRPAAARATCA